MPHSLTPSEGLKTRARVFPNAVIRSKGDKATYYGPDFVNCKDTASLNFRLPLEKVAMPVSKQMGKLGKIAEFAMAKPQ